MAEENISEEVATHMRRSGQGTEGWEVGDRQTEATVRAGPEM